VENQSLIIRFGITADSKRSSFWRVRAGMKQPELFLEREDYGTKYHFSLRASGQWHMKESGKERHHWAKPAEIVPGYTRAVGIVQPVAVAHREDPAPEDVVLVPVAVDADPTTFSLFIERPGANLKVLIGASTSRSSVRPRAPQPGGRNRLNRHRFQCLVTWRKETSDQVRPGLAKSSPMCVVSWRR
jgi:hypothetical protein